jgi:pyrimidine deaminase RibD-like protein
MSETRSHHDLLQKALELAKIRRGFCAPNPSVGSVIADEKGEIIAGGYHMGPGLAHAEVDALNILEHPLRRRGSTSAARRGDLQRCKSPRRVKSTRRPPSSKWVKKMRNK